MKIANNTKNNMRLSIINVLERIKLKKCFNFAPDSKRYTSSISDKWKWSLYNK